jgi:hypothetical protein
MNFFQNMSLILQNFNYTSQLGGAIGVQIAQQSNQLGAQAQQAETAEQRQTLYAQSSQLAAQSIQMMQTANQFQIGYVDSLNKIGQASLKLLG